MFLPPCHAPPPTSGPGPTPSSHETVGCVGAGLGLSCLAQAPVPWWLRMGEGTHNKDAYSQDPSLPSPLCRLQPYLLFFLFGFLGTCSQGFL